MSWVSHHRRSEELANALGYEPLFIKGSSRWLPIRYCQQWFTTWQYLRPRRPAVIMVMQPPFPALLCVLAYAVGRKVFVIGDLHSGTFSDPRWKWATKMILRILRRYGMAVVPNGDLAQKCEAAQVPTIVSHAYLTPRVDQHQPLMGSVAPPPGKVAEAWPTSAYILVPLTYSFDEPVESILESARMTPTIQWVLTGNPPDAVVARASSNVIFSGFVSRADYLLLRSGASAILALTTQESTMQSAGFEALSDGIPLVTSPTRVLQHYFGDAALYADDSARAIHDAVLRAVSEPEVWSDRMLSLRAEKVLDQDSAIAAISALIESRTNQ